MPKNVNIWSAAVISNLKSMYYIFLSLTIEMWSDLTSSACVCTYVSRINKRSSAKAKIFASLQCLLAVAGQFVAAH